jgi:hypothetical protein
MAAASLTLTPAYADSHGRPGVAPPHVQAPKTTGKPTVVSRPSGPTSPTTTLNPIALKISTRPQLASKVTSLLPSGMTLNRASTGFKNQGQFIAALHVSHNLGIPFSKLKTDMTGARHLSLGQSIQDLKPSAKAAAASRRAETEADHDIKTTTTTALNPIAQKISSHPQLAAKVAALLPAGLTLDQASKGFKNQGQFLAALHASKDLNIPFAQLKAEMTGQDHDSLGVAIHELKPGIDARTAVRTADQEADADMKARPPQPTSHTGDPVGDDH